MKTYVKNGSSIYYDIEYKKIKNAYFRVKDGCVYITSSKDINLSLVMDMIDSNFEKFLELIETDLRNHVPDDVLYLFNKEYELIIDNERSNYHICEHNSVIFVPNHELPKIKRQILREQLLKRIPNVLSQIEKNLLNHKISLVPIKVRMLKSRYGSCNVSTREILLNSFLATTSEIYLEYVLYHEFAHLKVPNHSKKFYNLLDKLMPDHKQIQRDLKKLPIIY